MGCIEKCVLLTGGLEVSFSIYEKFICWNGILTKTAMCKNFNSKFDWIQNIHLKIGVPSHKKECPPAIQMHTKPFIVSTNLSMIQLFNKTFLGPLHDMSTTLEMIISGYP